VDDDWPQELFECDFGTPPERIDEGIARVAALDGDPDTRYLLAQLLWIRCGQAALIPGRRSAPDDLDRIVDACDEAMVPAGVAADERG
jgi:hypothetical protein